ncbi:claudin-23-like [Sinocyclocheilus rhinocerous]|uniref:Claudin-23-like n=2 Tax=Sinocyclocheilus rhinocerous TaxID=307959 RepID=A0A673MJD7_9TELE|nr:PREDICTED: claudin-23-like [Sinocyclocheilus rhinocerous]
MRTPGIFIFGLVLAPCGWILELTSTVAPAWRTINNIPGEPSDLVLQQGLWDICRTFTSSRDILCNQQDTQYFSAQIIQIARGLMLSSLILNVIAIGVAAVGVRCWTEKPLWTVAGVGGLLIFISGVLTIIPVAWYTHTMTSIFSASTDVRVGYCLVLGFIGGIMEVLGGLVMSIGLCRRCSGQKRDPSPPRRDTVPSVSSGSSVPYYSKQSEVDFARAKRQQDSRPATSTAYEARPYDTDL